MWFELVFLLDLDWFKERLVFGLDFDWSFIKFGADGLDWCEFKFEIWFGWVWIIFNLVLGQIGFYLDMDLILMKLAEKTRLRLIKVILDLEEIWIEFGQGWIEFKFCLNVD